VKYPIPCPNKCDTGTIEQGFLEEHLSECPLQLLKCEFHLAGCKEKIQRKDLEDHVEKNIGKHLNLLSVFTKDLLAEKQRETQKLAEKEKKISQLHRVRTQMQNELREKDKQIKLLQTRVRTLETASLLPPVEFTLHNYSQYEGMGTRWSDGPTFYTHPTGYKVKIRVYFTQFFRRADLELQSMEGEFDDELKWPLKGTLTIQLLNQLTMQLALAAVTFESQAEVYNAIHAAEDATRLRAFEMKFRRRDGEDCWKLNVKRLEDGWFVYQLCE